MNRLRRLILTSIIFASASSVMAQYGSFGLTDARQLGMGNTYASNSRELYAAGKNPSLLAWHANDRRLDILFPSLSARAYNINTVTTFLNDFFAQKPLDIITSIDGRFIKKALESDGKLFLGLQIGFLAAGYTPNEKIGSFSFAMKDYIDAYLQLPTAIVEYNNGNHSLSDIYLDDFGFRSYWTRSYELSYGRMFKTNPESGVSAIYGGIGLKYITGFIFREIQFSGGGGYEDESGVLYATYNANSSAAFSDDINIGNAFEGQEIVSHVPFMSPVGRGFGFDAGVTVLLEPGVKLGISLTDAGLINWRGKTEQTSVSGSIRIDSTLTIDDIDSIANSIVIDKQSSDHFKTHPPSAIHVGFSFMVDRFVKNFPGEMNVTVELHQGIANSIENPDQIRVALGLDWKPGRHWPVFLTGLSSALNSGIAWSVGLGYELRFLELYISSPNILPKFENSDVQTLSLSMCWHFVKPKEEKKK